MGSEVITHSLNSIINQNYKYTPPDNLFKNRNLEIFTAKGDSGASAYYWRAQNSACLDNIIDKIGPTVNIPKNDTISTTLEDVIPHLPELLEKSKKAVVLPQLKIESLISLG